MSKPESEMSNSRIPTVDLCPFFREVDDDDDGEAGAAGRKEALKIIGEACSEYGFFQIENHGVPVSLMSQALELSKTFFDYPDEEKKKSSPVPGAPLPAGYNRQPQHSPDENEYILMFPPASPFNICPPNPPQLREVMEEVFTHLVRVGSLMEGILNECLGLPPNFLREFNHDRSWDFMAALRYFPATEAENNGITEHEDGNLVTFVFQDEVGGLQVRNEDGEWIPVTPTTGTIVVNLGDVIQVMSNKKLMSASHKVVRPKDKSRHSYAFFYNLHGDKWIEPLPHFTTEIGDPPKYRGFFYKDYQELRLRNKTHPPSNPEDVIHITHYAITYP